MENDQLTARVRLGVVTDAHLAPPETPIVSVHGPLRFDRAEQLWGDAIARLADLDLDGLLVLGDITHFGDVHWMNQALESLEAFAGPVWIVPGNHDLGVRPDMLAHAIADRASRVRPAVREVYPLTPTISLTGLDLASEDGGMTVSIEPILELSEFKSPITVVLSHFPLLSRRDAARVTGIDFGLDAVGAREQSALFCEGVNPVVLLHGHFHLQDAVSAGMLLQIGFASLIESPHEIATVEIQHEPDDSWLVRIKRFSAANDAARPTLTPAIPPVRHIWRFDRHQWTSV